MNNILLYFKNIRYQKIIHFIETACLIVLFMCIYVACNVSDIKAVEDKDNTSDDISGYVKITEAQDLFLIASDPAGHYILESDIDMAGYQWSPIDFSGELEGNGHAIINLTVNSVSESSRITYDGNMKTYDTIFSGMFSSVENAIVSNLNLINERITVETDNNCFIAGIAGYSDHSTISGCTINGTYELTTGSHMFGVAGAIGFGNGTIQNSDIDVTLICTDTNVDDKDEQFMGGVIADGYMTISNCNVNIAGYDSDHGYVHDGGIIGMNMPYPRGNQESGNIKNCTVNGFITFFEDNTDRRAYCSAIYGEMLGGLYVSNNKENFKRDERYDYSVNLRPEQCVSPKYTTLVTQADCYNFGYTSYTCETCGYTYKDNYTLKQHHVTNYSVINEPDYEHTGLEQGVCDICGQTVSKGISKLVKVQSAVISDSSLELKKKENVQLTVAVTPADAAINNAVWESSDENVATVDMNGIITAVGNGKAVISYVSDGNVIAKSTVTVKGNAVAVILICILVVAGIIAVITGIMYINMKRKRKKRRHRR